MADPLKILKDLSARAREENPPSIDVSSRVLLRLSRKTPAPAWPMTSAMALVASGSAVAALVALSISLPLFEMATDPWSVFFILAANTLP